MLTYRYRLFFFLNVALQKVQKTKHMHFISFDCCYLVLKLSALVFVCFKCDLENEVS